MAKQNPSFSLSNATRPGSKSANSKNRVRRIGSLVNQLMSRKGYAQAAAGDHLQQSIAGAIGELSSCCQVGNLRAGVLQVYVTDSVSLQELNFRKRAILKQLQKDVPDGKVNDVRFRIQS